MPLINIETEWTNNSEFLVLDQVGKPWIILSHEILVMKMIKGS